MNMNLKAKSFIVFLKILLRNQIKGSCFNCYMGNVIMVIKTEYMVYKKWLCKKLLLNVQKNLAS